jgi:hypothetical protein
VFVFEGDAGDERFGLSQRQRDFRDDEVNHEQVDRLLRTHLDEMIESGVWLMMAVLMIGVVRLVMGLLALKHKSLRILKMVFRPKMEIGVADLKDEQQQDEHTQPPSRRSWLDPRMA